MMVPAEEVYKYLKIFGPCPFKELAASLNICSNTLSKKLQVLLFAEMVETFKFGIGTPRSSKFTSLQLFGSLASNLSGKIIACKDDPRLVRYVSDRIPNENRKSASQLLNRIVGKPRSTEIVNLVFGYSKKEKRMEEDRGLQWEIENDWELNKLLVTAMNPKMFFYEIGKYGLYVQFCRPIPPNLTNVRRLPYHFGKKNVPHLVIVRSKYKDDVLPFIKDHLEFQVSRIFKSGLYFPKLDEHCLGGFSKSTVKNMVHLKPGTPFRIKCADPDVRNIFYEHAVLINDESGTQCTFDFDEYDYTLEIKTYKRVKGYAVITLLYGWDLPNHWHL